MSMNEQLAYISRTTMFAHIRMKWFVLIITGNATRGYNIAISNPDNYVPVFDSTKRTHFNNYVEAFRYIADCMSVANSYLATI